MPKQGRRTDIHEIRELIKEGKNFREIAEVATSYQALRGAQMLLATLEIPRTWRTRVYWFWGPTGTGKTRTAYELFPKLWTSCFDKLKWWEGYDGHKIVLLDNFRTEACSASYLLKLLDRYPFKVENKGSSRQMLADVIVITCPFPPHNIGWKNEDYAQLMRRIDQTLFFGDGTDYFYTVYGLEGKDFLIPFHTDY